MCPFAPTETVQPHHPSHAPNPPPSPLPPYSGRSIHTISSHSHSIYLADICRQGARSKGGPSSSAAEKHLGVETDSRTGFMSSGSSPSSTNFCRIFSTGKPCCVPSLASLTAHGWHVFGGEDIYLTSLLDSSVWHK